MLLACEQQDALANFNILLPWIRCREGDRFLHALAKTWIPRFARNDKLTEYQERDGRETALLGAFQRMLGHSTGSNHCQGGAVIV
jgi:hypothetical protein